MTSRPGNNDPIREEVLNVLLAELLRGHGVPAKAERRSREGTPDIRVELPGGDLALVECKWPGNEGALDEQLRERLAAFPDALGVYGLVYPEELRTAADPRAELAAASNLSWRLHGSRGAALSGVQSHTGSAEAFADELRMLPLQLEGADRVKAAADAVGYAVEQSAKQISHHSRISRRVANIIAETDKERERAAALRIGCLVLFNALAFQDRLAAADEEAPTVSEVLSQGVSGLSDTWRDICTNIDYIPVFRIAMDILDELAHGPDDLASLVVNRLARAVKDTRNLEGHDLSGRLFHTLLSNAKFTGAYYTSVPAATMLARLVFNGWPAGVDWRDYEYPGSLNIADLACGTGTLLMAVAAEAERLHKSAGGENAALLHKVMVEQALYGYDVQLSAIHFAATSLAMLNPDIQFDRMNLYVMPLGVEGKKTSLGSLDFLGTEEAAVQFALSPDAFGVGEMDAQRVSGRGARGAREGQTAKLPDLDLAIMNPPFTRSVGGNLLFGSIPSVDRGKLQKELSRRLKQLEGRERVASATAGLGGAFVAAASPRLRPGEGRLALVLPLSVCTGPSWSTTRALIERDYALDMVVTSHDPRRWNFSDSTQLSEALLIATRRAEGDTSERRTTFVNLWRNPDGVLDAQRTAQAIANTAPANLEDTGAALLAVNRQHVGEAVSIRESQLRGKKWVGVQFARADLARIALRLLDDGELQLPGEASSTAIPLCRLDEVGAIGPDRRDVWDGFARTDAVTAYAMLEDNQTEERKTLSAAPNKYLAPLTEARPTRRLKPLNQLWPKAGRLLIAERSWLNTARVIALSTTTPVLSNVWWPIQTGDRSRDKALASWFNSSVGLLALLATRNTTRGGWIGLKKGDLEEMPALDPRQLSPEQLRGLSDLFDALQGAEFERLPNMAQCPARIALDEGVARILGLPPLDTLRALLASEPVVANRRL